MADLSEIQNFDAGGDAFSGTGAEGGSKVHIRVQQRNGRKCITSIQGLDDDLDLKRILKYLKKRYNCNGSIIKDKELGEVIQLQGDQRQNVREFLLGEEIYDKPERIVIHGF
eukprot:gb/GECG01005800.1/.p1 GENE.gb/GECG01005800.1/~~gb/GECG01005800.1/.p1  ORF type:complete len:112 (+),score=15.94 gb/GECG01005800.1/:1-336(+)